MTNRLMALAAAATTTLMGAPAMAQTAAQAQSEQLNFYAVMGAIHMAEIHIKNGHVDNTCYSLGQAYKYALDAKVSVATFMPKSDEIFNKFCKWKK